MRPSGPGLYFDGRLNYSLLIIGLVRYFISYDSVIVQCIYVENLFISLYIIFLRDFIYLKLRVTQIGRDTGIREIVHLLVHLSNDYSGLNCVRLKPGAKNPIWAFHWDGREKKY